MESVLASGTVVDPSSSLSFWGSHLRGREACIALFVGREVEGAGSSSSASNMLQASLISQLSCLGRDNVDFAFLPVRRALEEHQINGALEALEFARQDGLVSNFGLAASGSAFGVLSTWQFHDAFEALMIPAEPDSSFAETLAPVARTRRVGVAVCQPVSWGQKAPLALLPSVAKAAQEHGVGAAAALAAHASQFGSILAGARSAEEWNELGRWEQALPAARAVADAARLAMNDPAEWAALAADPRPWVRQAAARRAA